VLDELVQVERPVVGRQDREGGQGQGGRNEQAPPGWRGREQRGDPAGTEDDQRSTIPPRSN